jgi:transcription-repair coupling factor (superfamily II helicase)
MDFLHGFFLRFTPLITAQFMILEDMSSAQPMDRVVCGDVGFGKTEVAMRATFIAAQSGKQVAILVPTTLLAQQHFQKKAWPLFNARLA